MNDFDMAALSAALDAKRCELGLTWQGLAQQATERPSRRAQRRIAPSTFKGMSERRAVRDTVVLQALRWLGRSPESFVPGFGDDPRYLLPDNGAGRPTIDAESLYEALCATRAERGMTWQEVAAEIGGGYTASSLAGLAWGGAMGFPAVMRVFGWILRPVKEFVRFEPDDGE